MLRFGTSAADASCLLQRRSCVSSGAVRGLTQVPEVRARYAALCLGATGRVRILPHLSYRANRSADNLFINYRYVTVTSQQHSAFGRCNWGECPSHRLSGTSELPASKSST